MRYKFYRKLEQLSRQVTSIRGMPIQSRPRYQTKGKRIFQDWSLNIITGLWNVKFKSLSPDMGCCLWDGTKPSYPLWWMLHAHSPMFTCAGSYNQQAGRKINKVFGVGTDSSSAQDTVFTEHLRSLSCNHLSSSEKNIYPCLQDCPNRTKMSCDCQEDPPCVPCSKF